MTDIKKILETIDISKMETKYVDFSTICENEFEIHEWLQQPKDNEKLTYCYYQRWICTDTEVGIRVWYFENKPVCISYQPFRKSDEAFGWLSKEDFETVRNYAFSLVDNSNQKNINIIDNETISNIVEKFSTIDYKKFEVLNVIL